ncbi:MAG: DJ-1/PfpI family protein [Anaerolineae bacterium]|nr:DJ-1/PfpI family protein [Anaerolineae bacterium]
MPEQRNVAILIFDDVEVLDFAGPFEVFSVTGDEEKQVRYFNTYTVAETPGSIITAGGLSINPKYTIDACPPPDILLVPGGFGTRREMKNEHLLQWIRETAGSAELLLSVCTGALVIGAAGLLDGLKATTFHTCFDLLREAAPAVEVIEEVRFIDNGKVVTSAGVSAGIDMTLYVVGRLLGEEQARTSAAHMEYDWRP